MPSNIIGTNIKVHKHQLLLNGNVKPRAGQSIYLYIKSDLKPSCTAWQRPSKKNPSFAWENRSSVQAASSADGRAEHAEQTINFKCDYLTKRTKKNSSQCLPSATTGPTDTSGTPQAPALVAGPVNWDLLSTQLELAHQCYVCYEGSHQRRTLAFMMPRPSECVRIHWKSVDTTCNCEQPSARRPLLSSWWPSWYYKFLLYFFCHQNVICGLYMRSPTVSDLPCIKGTKPSQVVRGRFWNRTQGECIPTWKWPSYVFWNTNRVWESIVFSNVPIDPLHWRYSNYSLLQTSKLAFGATSKCKHSSKYSMFDLESF